MPSFARDTRELFNYANLSVFLHIINMIYTSSTKFQRIFSIDIIIEVSSFIPKNKLHSDMIRPQVSYRIVTSDNYLYQIPKKKRI